jgi:small GTP-binding protein
MLGTYTFNILVCGDANSGKSSLISRYCKGKFPREQLSTIGIDLQIKYLNEEDNKNENDKKEDKITLKCYDTSGQERFNSVIRNFYRVSDGVFITFDLTNINSYNNIGYWFNQIKEVVDCPIILLCNKLDMKENRKIYMYDIEKIAKGLNIPFYEVSARDGDNIDAAFEHMAKLLIEKSKKEEKGKNIILDKSIFSNMKEKRC